MGFPSWRNVEIFFEITALPEPFFSGITSPLPSQRVGVHGTLFQAHQQRCQTLQWRECQEDDSVPAVLRPIGGRNTHLAGSINFFRALLVQPDTVNLAALKFLPALLIGFELATRKSAAYMANLE